jgi:hypothetical protein
MTDHYWPIGPARPTRLTPDEALDAEITRCMVRYGCPACQQPLSEEMIARRETAHPECRRRHAGKFRYVDGRGRAS